MKNSVLKFKTNINCMGCVEKITLELEQLGFIETWKVDTSNKDKILTVELPDDKENEVISTVEKAGFKIEKIKE